MKAKTLFIILGVVTGAGLLYWAFTRDTTTTGQQHVPAGSRESYGKEKGILEGVASIIDAAAAGTALLADAFRSESPEKTDQGTGQAAATGAAASIFN